MLLFKHRAKFVRDPLWQENWNARADPHEFDMRNGPQFAEQVLKLVIAEEQRVAAAEQHVADRRIAADIIELPSKVRMKIVAGGVAHQPRACAVPAIAGAAVGDEKEHTVGIAMDQSGNG